MSGLTKKTVYADSLLSTILGVSEGDLVSYAQISKGLHKYIKDHNLKNVSAKPQSPPQPELQEVEAASTNVKQCKDCGAEIPFEAVFCDMCGVTQ